MRVKLFALVGAAAAVLTLSGCQGPSGRDELAGPGREQAAIMGNAEPQASPASTDPAGTVHEHAPVDDLDATGGLVAVRSGGTLSIGTLEDVVSGKATEYALGQECGDTTARDGRFVTACGREIRMFGSAGEEKFSTQAQATAAALTADGDVIAGSEDDREVRVYRGGEEIDSFNVARETDQLLTVPRAEQPDTAVRINHFDTTIQDLDLDNGRQGGTLRVGLGVGGVSTGGDGLVLAADNTGSQLLVYTATDIIRLQQSAPVAESPWAVAWDNDASLAWVTSTAGNTVSGYDISQGVPLERVSLRTVADALNMAALDDGTLIIASASGDGLQVISPDEKNAPEGDR
ncbi:hypothetical protein G7Y29_05500 [Corynebacterium qintianiae]|uniref:Prolipoprotein LppL n=1 Tax=Corynebacterium qintianiae TaxID=2709392 RepID=A0A7T0PGQ7_9CORY|nr:hypothetical protein [Corynebacterium qintianiae]QPK84297.1 hypothetical protein G7Y29_05500 [Corynebacterium qintianiae]